MNSLYPSFQKRDLDVQEWQRTMQRHPYEYIRRKLRVVEAYHNIHSVQEVVATLHLHPRTIRAYLNIYIQGGLQILYLPEKRPRPTTLTPEQEAAFKHQLLHSRPTDHGLTGNIWTGELMRQYLTRTYGVDYPSGAIQIIA